MNWLHDLWVKIKADKVNASALIGAIVGEAMSYLENLFQAIAANLDQIAVAMNDPAIIPHVHNIITDATHFGWWTKMASGVVILARFQKLVPSPKA